MSTPELQRQHQWMGKADRENSIDPNSSQAATANWSDGNRRVALPREEHINCFSSTKFSVLKSCIQRRFYELTRSYLVTYVYILMKMCNNDNRKRGQEFEGEEGVRRKFGGKKGGEGVIQLN